jgi:uncharacterized protein (TIGR03437 family)
MNTQPTCLAGILHVAVSAALLSTAVADAQTGHSVPELAALEQQVLAVTARYRLPGYSLAIARDGKLLYARGFGWADRDKQLAVQPESMFRTGSISKPLTAVAMLRLQEQGRLRLDDRVFDLLTEYQDAIGDSRIRQITVRQLLHHIAGWDSQLSGDPLFPEYNDIVSAGGSYPPAHDEVIRAWLPRPLDFSPGTAYRYSNFGFMLAGRVIEKVTGTSYERAVRDLVLDPLGITRMRIGRSLQNQGAPDEVQYYDIYSRSVTSIFSPIPQQAPFPYGGFSLDLADSAGGWIASAPDLVRLFTAMNGTRGSLLTPESFQQFVASPPGLKQASAWYGLGISVGLSSGGYNLVHNGSIPGTYGFAFSLWDGVTVAFLTNTNPGDSDPAEFEDELLTALLQAVATTTQWPAADQCPDLVPVGPVPTLRSLVSTASFVAGSISPGELVSLLGAGLGSDQGSGFRLVNDQVAPSLDGVRVWFDGTPAPVLYQQDQQVNAIAPFDLAGKTEFAVAIERNGVRSAPAIVPVVAARPAAFLNGSLAASLNQDGTIHGTSNPAARGWSVTLFVTGLGALTTPVADGAVARSILPEPLVQPQVSLDGKPVAIDYA